MMNYSMEYKITNSQNVRIRCRNSLNKRLNSKELKYLMMRNIKNTKQYGKVKALKKYLCLLQMIKYYSVSIWQIISKDL